MKRNDKTEWQANWGSVSLNETACCGWASVPHIFCRTSPSRLRSVKYLIWRCPENVCTSWLLLVLFDQDWPLVGHRSAARDNPRSVDQVPVIIYFIGRSREEKRENKEECGTDQCKEIIGTWYVESMDCRARRAALGHYVTRPSNKDSTYAARYDCHLTLNEWRIAIAHSLMEGQAPRKRTISFMEVQMIDNNLTNSLINYKFLGVLVRLLSQSWMNFQEIVWDVHPFLLLFFWSALDIYLIIKGSWKGPIKGKERKRTSLMAIANYWLTPYWDSPKR